MPECCDGLWLKSGVDTVVWCSVLTLHPRECEQTIEMVFQPWRMVSCAPGKAERLRRHCLPCKPAGQTQKQQGLLGCAKCADMNADATVSNPDMDYNARRPVY